MFLALLVAVGLLVYRSFQLDNVRSELRQRQYLDGLRWDFEADEDEEDEEE